MKPRRASLCAAALTVAIGWPARRRRRCGRPPAACARAAQKIAIDARGPLALVEVTRTVVPEPAEGGGGNEALLDLALPDGERAGLGRGARRRALARVDAGGRGSRATPPRPTAPRAPPAA